MMETYEQRSNIKSWNENDRPHEKLLAQGRRALSEAELIAILIGSGHKDQSAVDLGRQILGHYKNSLDMLGKQGVTELCKFKGIGEAKAISIIAALELGRRRKEEPAVRNPKITSSSDCFTLMQHEFADLQHEEFWILLLNRGNMVIGSHKISSGGFAATIADPRIIFGEAMAQKAAGLILMHNHPSGNRTPSEEDKRLTQRLHDGGKLLEISVLDHVIFAGKSYFSFRDEGLL